MRKIKFLLFVCLAVAGISASISGQPAKSHWAKYNGGRVRYYDIGNAKNKKALILIHGWSCNADFWKDSYSAFPGYRVIAIDLPGHGQSDKPKTTYSMEYFAKSIDAVMKTAKVKQGVLVGHSMGTPVIRQFYRLFPSEVLGLVTVDGPLKPYGSKAQMEQFLAPLRTNYAESGPKMVDGLLGPMKDETLKKSVREAMLATPNHVAISAMDGMIDDAIWVNDQIKVPVLAIMNAEGRWPADTGDVYRAIAPSLEFQSWTGVSHFLFMEKPKEFNEAILSFVVKNKLL